MASHRLAVTRSVGNKANLFMIIASSNGATCRTGRPATRRRCGTTLSDDRRAASQGVEGGKPAPTAAPCSLDSVGAAVPLRGGTPRIRATVVGLMMVV